MTKRAVPNFQRSAGPVAYCSDDLLILDYSECDAMSSLKSRPSALLSSFQSCRFHRGGGMLRVVSPTSKDPANSLTTGASDTLKGLCLTKWVCLAGIAVIGKAS